MLQIPAHMYSKAYSRLGTALFYEGSYERAVENYARALELDPTNAAYEADLRAAQEKVREVELSATATTGFDFSSMSRRPCPLDQPTPAKEVVLYGSDQRVIHGLYPFSNLPHFPSNS